eukprot:15221641-Alexandrium_andersonii.AAC.1
MSRTSESWRRGHHAANGVPRARLPAARVWVRPRAPLPAVAARVFSGRGRCTGAHARTAEHGVPGVLARCEGWRAP